MAEQERMKAAEAGNEDDDIEIEKCDNSDINTTKYLS